MSNVLEMVGQTPLIRLDKIAKSEGLKCDLCKYAYACVCNCACTVIVFYQLLTTATYTNQ